MASLAATFGRGAMTNGWTDVANADVVLVMGGNPAENHPVGFRFVMEAKRKRKAKLVCIDPRFNRTAAVSDCYVPIRAGTDIAFLGGLIHYALSRKLYHADYVRLHTNASFLIQEGFAFNEGYFSGWDPRKKAYDKSSWRYELDSEGYAKVDPTLEHPRSVFQLMKKHYSRYTPEKWRPSAAARPTTSNARQRSSARLGSRIAAARSSTRSAGRSTATPCS